MDVASDERVLIVATAGRDGELLRDALGRVGIAALICSDVPHLVREMAVGVGAAVLTEEALDMRSIAALRQTTAAQPPWSDVPILILTSSRTPGEEKVALATAESLGNVMMVHRPASVATFLSSVRAALRMRRRQYEIRGYVLELQANSRAKDEFLAMLGHELRNPLSAVRNAVVTASLDEVRRPRALEIARRQTDQLGRLIDDLLDVARITQGRITLREERAYLGEILERSIDSMRSFIASRGLRLSVSVPAERIRMDADPARLEQVFVNLLSNAGKYTDAGGHIEVTVERSNDHVIVRIRDSGIGIVPELLPRIWDLFAQADRGLDRTQGGLGVGLTVARRLVELHGGWIHVHSDGLGRGAEFSVCLPVLPADEVSAAVDARPQNAIASGRGRVLIVEDNPDAAESLALLLELFGHRVRTVHDGISALDAARANMPDLMLVDIGLPGIDGYEVARRIRRDAALKHLVLVALTGYGQAADKQHAIEAGFDYHLVKPVDPQALRDLVGRIGSSGKAPAPLHNDVFSPAAS